MADQNQQNNQYPFNPKPLGPENQPSLTDEKMMPVRDGDIPQNAAGVTQGQFDALDPVGTPDLAFAQGNYNQMVGLPQLVGQKIAQLTQTLVPLIEVAMIELLGSNTMYRRQLGQCMPSFDQAGNMVIGFTFQYFVEHWVGQDVDLQAIQHDSNYILSRVQPSGANLTKCEIDCGEGALTIMGSI